MLRLVKYTSQHTENICITFVQRRPNVFDVGPALNKCYTNVWCLLGGICRKRAVTTTPWPVITGDTISPVTSRICIHDNHCSWRQWVHIGSNILRDISIITADNYAVSNNNLRMNQSSKIKFLKSKNHSMYGVHFWF